MSTATAQTNTEISSDSYNEIPYPGGAFRPTHPSHLALVAKLCGLEPTSPRNCRVLELGCSMGSNLIPMAESLPNSHFVGIDFASSQVKIGNSIIQELGLKNIEIKHLSILDVDDDLGEFDYIVCHGVYSWVPHDVQNKILDIGRQHLTSNGIMYVSYNTYPGWHLRGVVREMMQYHVADFPTPKQKISQARGLLDFLVKHARARSQAYPTLLKDEAEMLSNSLDSYLFHEHLEEVNEPLYFHQFVSRVDHAGLRYLADSAISTMLAQMFDDSAAEILRGAPLLRREQYMDFLRSRMFRSSLLCKPNLNPDYRLDSHHLMDLHVSLRRPLGIVARADNKIEWQNPDGKITTEEPVTSAIDKLNRSFPAWTKVSDLVQHLPTEALRKQILDALMMSFVQNVVHLSFEPVEACSVINEKPICSPLARYQAARGDRITSLIHHDYIVQPQQRFMINHLDGSRTVKDLARLLGEEVRNKRFKVSKEGKDITPDESETMRICEEELNRLRCLHMLTG